MAKGLEQYKIDDANRIMELRYFCRQYPLWVTELEQGVGCSNQADVTGIKNVKINDPTARDAVRTASLIEKCRMVEQSAIAASADYYQKIMEIVTSDIPYKYFSVPISRGDFKLLLHKFFYILNWMKG